MTSLLKGRGLIAVAVLLATATLEAFLAPAEASVAPAFTSGSPLPLATLGLEATEGLPWVGGQRLAQFETHQDVDPYASTSTDMATPVLCSTVTEEFKTCSTGFGGSGDEKQCSAFVEYGQCSAWSESLCSASVDGHGGAGEQCSAFSKGGSCSTLGPDTVCSATGRAACSALDLTEARCSVIYSGPGNCSVTQGQGGVCTTTALGTEEGGSQCSTFVEGGGHCSVWGGDNPPSGPDDNGLCHG